MDEYSKHKVLSVGDATESGYKLMSANSSGAVFQDLHGKLVSIGINNEISATFNHAPEAVESIPLNEQNQYVANVTINNNDTSIPAIIDTGANLVTLNSETATSLGIEYKNDAAKVHVATASENTDGYKVMLNSLKLGSISLSYIDAIVIEGHEPEMVLIGMSFLKQLDLQYLGNKLEIKLHGSNANSTSSTVSSSTFAPPPASVKSTPSKEPDKPPSNATSVPNKSAGNNS